MSCAKITDAVASMAGLRSSFYCLLLLVIMLSEGSCQQTPNGPGTQDEIFMKSFKDETGAGPHFVFENNTEEDDGKLNVVLDFLEKLQNQVDELQTNIETMCSPENFKQTRPMVMKIVEKAHCPQNAPYAGPQYEINNCGKGTGNYKSYYLVDGATTSYADSEGFCTVFSMIKLPEKHYSIKAVLYNVIATYGTYYGFPGIAFNVKDQNNYDFVMIRIHDHGGCYRTGFIQNGKVHYIGSRSGLCPAGNPRGRSWFTIEVQVKDNRAVLFINNMQTALFRPHFSSFGKGGVIVKLGEKNVIRFKGLMIQPIFGDFFHILNCFSHQRVSANYYRLDSRGGVWPEEEFCKAISNEKVQSSDYSVSAQLFNQRGAYGTHMTGSLGIMYNAKDDYNYDYITFQPGSKNDCYFTGFVQNSNVKWTNSEIGPCAGGKFKGGQWNNVTLYIRDNILMVYLDGRHILTTKPHFESRAVAGVIVPNKHEGSIISFMDFKIEAVLPNSLRIHNCFTKTQKSNEYYILDAKHGEWPEDTFCGAFLKVALPGKNYVISAEMFKTEKGSRKKNKEYFGLAFNFKDELNYDFVFVRPEKNFCYYAGYLRNGKLRYVSKLDGECKGGPPNKDTWFQIKVYVRDSIAMVELDHNHLITISTHFETNPRGGVIVANGFKNMLTFRNFNIAVIEPLPMKLNRCGPKTNVANATITLDAAFPYWPYPNLFCSALYKEMTNQAKDMYTVETMLYNVDSYVGSYWGQPGMMFNAFNSYTFEYVYIRIHNKGNCYQFGTVQAGRITEKREDSRSCLSMRPQQNEWFRMAVKVSKSGEVHLIIDSVFIAKNRASLKWNPRGGILAPNGFRNIIMARNYTIY